MKKTVKNLLAIARKEIGYHEKESNAHLDNPGANAGDGNYTKYARDLAAAGYYQASKQGYAWCDVFVDWCFLQLAGTKAAAEAMQCQTGVYGAGCGWSARYYKAQGRLDRKFSAGDQIFFGAEYDHTGIIEKVEDGWIHTIEGNSGNQVQRRKYCISDPWVKDCGHPFYEEDDATEEEETPAPAPTPAPDTERIESGDLVEIVDGAQYYNGGSVPDWVCARKWVVVEVSGDRAVIDKDAEGVHSICSPISVKYLHKVGAAPAEKPLCVGDVVTLDSNATVYGQKRKFSSWVYGSKLYVREITDDRIVISTQRTGAITGAVDRKYLHKA